VQGASIAADLFPVLGGDGAGGPDIYTRGRSRYGGRHHDPQLRFMQDIFAGERRRVLGRKVLLDGVPYMVIGVMPKDFYFPNRRAQLWTALRLPPQAYEDRNDDFVYGIARLKPGGLAGPRRAPR